MTPEEARRLMPGNRVHDWVLLDNGTVYSIYQIQDHIKVVIHYDHGESGEYWDDEMEYLDRSD